MRKGFSKNPGLKFLLSPQTLVEMAVFNSVICIFQAVQLISKEGCSEYCEEATRNNHKSKKKKYQNTTNRGRIKKNIRKEKATITKNQNKTTNKIKIMKKETKINNYKLATTTKAEDLALQKYLLSSFLFSGQYYHQDTK